MIVITLAEKEEINASPVHESKSDFAAPPPREVRTLAGPSRERYSIPPPAYDDLYLPSTSTTSSSAVHGHQSNSPTPYASPTPLSLPYASPYPSPSPSPTLSASALLSPGSQPYPFAVPPTGAPSTDFVFDKLPGDNPKGFMGRMKGIAPGKSSTALLNPPPPSFRRQPPADIAREPFPIMVLVGEGASVDKGFAYVAPEPSGRVGAGSPPPPHPHDVHPFRTRDVYEQDWRLFLHDVRLAGSLSPMNKVVSGLTPLATGIGMVWREFCFCVLVVYRVAELIMTWLGQLRRCTEALRP